MFAIISALSCIVAKLFQEWVNLPNRYSRHAEGVTCAQTWASYSIVYQFGSLSQKCPEKAVSRPSGVVMLLYS